MTISLGTFNILRRYLHSNFSSMPWLGMGLLYQLLFFNCEIINNNNTQRQVQRCLPGQTTLLLKDEAKGSVPCNYRPITCLRAIWKLFSKMISELLYQHLSEHNFLPLKQKGCRRNNRGAKDHLLIDKFVLNLNIKICLWFG